MHLLFSRPDPYIGMTGRLNATPVERRIAGAPAFMRGLRLVFVSDTHVLRRTTDAQINALVAAIVRAEPDILLLGGDLSDKAEGSARMISALGALKPPLGAFAVLGNNDDEAWEGRRYELRRRLARSGCRLLINQAIRIKRGGGTLWIAGVDDHYYGSPDSTGLYPLRPRDDCYRVLLSHYPCAIPCKPDLMLSGHTHGGQFNLLGLTPFSIGFERLTTKKHRHPAMAVAGLHEIDGMKLLVSKGIGASRIQLRVCVRPEFDVLVFE